MNSEVTKYKHFFVRNNEIFKRKNNNQLNKLNKLLNNVKNFKIKTKKNNKNENKKIFYTIFNKGGSFSNNKEKINQDNYFFEIIDSYLYEIYIFGVFDGHGKNGKTISEYTSKFFLKHIKNYLINNFKMFNKIYFTNLINDLNKKFYEKSLDISLSGTTACICILYNYNIYIINIGDSKAIIANKKGDFFETVDHKPNNSLERERINDNGGLIKRFKDKNGNLGSYRIWNNILTLPGWNMSRSIGDKIAHNLGVISTPDFYCKKINIIKNKFILWATDGVWEYVDINKLIRKINKILNLKTMNKFDINEKIYNYIKKQWKKNGNYIDDITFILLKIN